MLEAFALIALSGCHRATPAFRAGGSEACEHETPSNETASASETHEGHGSGSDTVEPMGPSPIRTLEDGSRVFGRELQQGVERVALSAITADPQAFADRVVRTEGTIERVCQRMGCWMELRAENTEPVRVPMAGHSYFLPRDVAGRPATVEGRVVIQPLSEGRRRHLEAEGAVATASALAIEATSVVVR